MVFFTCNHCGESLKKPSVEKHYQWKSCRDAVPFLTCVDCLKDFRGNEFKEHTKCISEEEKYSAKGFVAKPNKNKGALKQESWTETLQNLINKPNLNPQIKQIVERVAAQNNVPRKKPKFINFVKNSMKISVDKAQQVWDIVEEALEEFKQTNQANDLQKKEMEKKTIENDDSAKDVDQPTANQADMKIKKNKKSQGLNDATSVAENNGQNEESNNRKRKMENLEMIVESVVQLPNKMKKNKKKKLNDTLESVSNGNSETANSSVQVSDNATDQANKKKKKNKAQGLNDSTSAAENNGQNEESNNRKRTMENLEKLIESVVQMPNKMKKNKKKKLNDTLESVSNGNSESENSSAQVLHNDPNESADLVQFDWQSVIEKTLSETKSPITINKLKTKVLKKYSALTSKHATAGIEKKFLKRLKTIPNVTITKQSVKWVQ